MLASFTVTLYMTKYLEINFLCSIEDYWRNVTVDSSIYARLVPNFAIPPFGINLGEYKIANAEPLL